MIAVVTLALAMAVAAAAAVVVLALRLRHSLGELSGAVSDSVSRLRPVADEIVDEIAVLQLEAEHVQASLQRLS